MPVSLTRPTCACRLPTKCTKRRQCRPHHCTVHHPTEVANECVKLAALLRAIQRLGRLECTCSLFRQINGIQHGHAGSNAAIFVQNGFGAQQVTAITIVHNFSAIASERTSVEIESSIVVFSCVLRQQWPVDAQLGHAVDFFTLFVANGECFVRWGVYATHENVRTSLRYTQSL